MTRNPTDQTLMLMIAGPRAGELVPATISDAEKAEAEGWAQHLTDRDSTYPFKTPKVGKNAKAEAWLAKHSA